MGTDDDKRLRQYINEASRLIDGHFERKFYPLQQTRYYNYQKAYSLLVDGDLLAVSALSAGGTAISPSDYWLYPLNTYPKWQIQIDKSKSTIFNYSGTHQRAVSVTGTWGWHNDWDYAWADSLDTVQDNPLSDSATTITVSEIEGDDVDGYSPRFSPGQLLEIEDEYVAVTGASQSAETLTVRRGVNGTTAASHAQNTTISVYRPPGVVVLAAKRTAKMIYEMRSEVGGIIAMPSMEGTAMRALMDDLLGDLSLPVKPDNIMRFV
jgi:hypothetical protein